MAARRKTKPRAGDPQWWAQPEGGAADTLWATLDAIGNRLMTRKKRLMRSFRAYGDVSHLSGSPMDITAGEIEGVKRLSVNVTKSCVNTLHAEVIATRPRPMFVTSGGDFEEQKRAKALTKWCEGLFYESKVDEVVAPKSARDALTFDVGVAKIVVEHGKVRGERVFPGEIMVDVDDGADGTPRSLYHVKQYDRFVLAELYPDMRDEILDRTVQPAFTYDWGCYRSTRDSDQVLVVEAWHLPSGPNANDGRHVIAIDRVTLLDEEWTDDSFPFAFMHWETALVGFYGIGVPEELRAHQAELNRLSKTIQEAQSKKGTYWIFVPAGSGVQKKHLTNADGPIIEYDGPQPPAVYPIPALAGDLYQWRSLVFQEAFSVLGVSALSAQSEKPAGLNSGRALRTYIDVKSQRFIMFHRAYEAFHVEIARQMVRAVRRAAEAAKRDGDAFEYEVVYRGKGHIERIKWSDVHLDEDAYVLQCFPVSALPQDPEGRMAAVEEGMKAGIFSPEQGFKLLDFPDLEAERDLMSAPRDLLQKILETMVETGRYFAPEPFFDLQLAVSTSSLFYQRCMIQGVEEERLALIRRFATQAKAMFDQAAAKAAAAAAPPAPTPAPAPMPAAA